jgi:hypothetical protein
MQLWSKQRELFLDPLKLLPTDRTVPAPAASPTMVANCNWIMVRATLMMPVGP